MAKNLKTIYSILAFLLLWLQTFPLAAQAAHYVPLKFAVVYVYTDDSNYNPDWQATLNSAYGRAKNGLSQITGGRVKMTYDILGAYQTDLYDWNAADAAIVVDTTTHTTTNYGTPSAQTAQETTREYYRLPGSTFNHDKEIIPYSGSSFTNENNGSTTYKEWTSQFIQYDCVKCSSYEETADGQTQYVVTFSNPASLPEVSYEDSLQDLKLAAAQYFGIDRNEYYDIALVFGRMGSVIPTGQNNNDTYFCLYDETVIHALSNHAYSEHGISPNMELIKCNEINSYFNYQKYMIRGWTSIVHEILHNFGALDVYDGSEYRPTALGVDPNLDLSIMSHADAPCLKTVSCSQTDKEYLYLDKYNQPLVEAGIQQALATQSDANHLDEMDVSDEDTSSYTPVSSTDPALVSRLKGYVLLQVESFGEAWYVHPDNGKRYYMKDGAKAYELMRYFSLGISDNDLSKIPSVNDTSTMSASSSACSSNSLANRLRGRIMLQVQQHGEAWYVDPVKCRRIYLRDGDVAYEIMRFLSLGISNTNLAKITEGAF